VNHEIQFYLTAANGKLLDVAQLQFQTKRSGGCEPDANGAACNGNGLCHEGYCICYDGFIGTDCSVADTHQGMNLATGEASYTSPGGTCSDTSKTTEATCLAPATWTPFVPNAAHNAYRTLENTNKAARTTIANTMGLAANMAEFHAPIGPDDFPIPLDAPPRQRLCANRWRWPVGLPWEGLVGDSRPRTYTSCRVRLRMG